MDFNRFTQEAVALARPLKRVIQREVQDPLALALLRGGDTVQVDVRDEKGVFERSGSGSVDTVAEATTVADAT
jgi:ATP-dependent Clp protease ATP-binding subunit ClpA